MSIAERVRSLVVATGTKDVNKLTKGRMTKKKLKGNYFEFTIFSRSITKVKNEILFETIDFVFQIRQQSIIFMEQETK